MGHLRHAREPLCAPTPLSFLLIAPLPEATAVPISFTIRLASVLRLSVNGIVVQILFVYYAISSAQGF